MTDASGGVVLYEASRAAPDVRSTVSNSEELSLIQEGLRGVVRLPEGTAHALDGLDFPIQVMGKTGTTSDFRDALFVGSTYGRQGITVAVRIGFDDNRALGERETGSRAALPVFREIMLRLYQDQLVGPLPRFPSDIEERIDEYLAAQAVRQAGRDERPPAHEPALTSLPATIADSGGPGRRQGVTSRSFVTTGNAPAVTSLHGCQGFSAADSGGARYPAGLSRAKVHKGTSRWDAWWRVSMIMGGVQ